MTVSELQNAFQRQAFTHVFLSHVYEIVLYRSTLVQRVIIVQNVHEGA